MWVAGDSLIVVPGSSILGAAGGSPVMEPLGGVDGRIATGLERPDVFNWFTHVSEQMKELEPHVVVFGFGGNDDHGYMTGLPEGTEIDGFGQPGWEKEYRRRVGGLMDTVARAGGYVVWVGLPITRDSDQSRRFDILNAIYQTEAKKRPRAATYVDTYVTFADDSGGFSEYLPNGAGRLIKMRASDGVHFERAGGDVIARTVLKRLNEPFRPDELAAAGRIVTVRIDDSLFGIDWEQAKADLGADDFDNGRTANALRLSFEQSQHVAIARDGDRVVGMARLLSDGVSNAYLIDVWTTAAYRRRGIASSMIRRLLDEVPGQHVGLQTDDAQHLYESLGFRPQPEFLSRVAGEWLDNDANST